MKEKETKTLVEVGRTEFFATFEDSCLWLTALKEKQEKAKGVASVS